ncbi:MAG: hypothetical protein WDM91_12420 [Rhizomicrobium sp.]
MTFASTVATKWGNFRKFAVEWRHGNIHTRRSAGALAQAAAGDRAGRHVVFLIAGANIVNGGLMSIASIARESARLLSPRGVRVSVCTALGQQPLRRLDKFDNTAALLPFGALLECLAAGSRVLVHVPECAVEQMILDHAALFARPGVSWSFNILLQNIDFIPSREVVARLQGLGPVTATVAHAAYADAGTAARLGCPVHLLSTWVSPEEFRRSGYADKERLVVVSPDPSPLRRSVLAAIAQALPDHRIVEIRDMTYRQYKATIARAKFAFTFGEGLDGYFVETVFSGGIGMAVYNSRFFTPDYETLPGLFADLQDDVSAIAAFLRAADRPERYGEVADRQFAMLAKKYVRAEYLSNLESYYATYQASLLAPDDGPR